MIVAIDFDGTIVEDRYPGIGKLKEGARETINALRHEGYYIIIWTSRAGIQLAEAIEFLVKQGICFDAINENNPENIAKYGRDTRKIFADMYIDDKMLHSLPDWTEIYDMIHTKFPTYADRVIEDGFL